MSYGLYRLLLPVLALVSLPGWLVKMARRGGWNAWLWERLSFYRGDEAFEVADRVHVHAVSVGEAVLALKLIRRWRERRPDARFVLAVGTATGFAIARQGGIEDLRVTYVPVDFRWMVRRYLERFRPTRLVLVEGEMWPNLMAACERRRIPVALVNARMSPRSRRRYEKFAGWIRPVFAKLDRVAVQRDEDRAIWQRLGVAGGRVGVTGSLKFDPLGMAQPARRAEFAALLDPLAAGRPVVLAASTHAGEELMVARACAEAGGFPLIVPRHAERRDEVRTALEDGGFGVTLRTAGRAGGPVEGGGACLVVDTTGELRDWIAHAAVVVIGKSFAGTGGQNPAEALLAGVPVVFGPHMENFEPLAGELERAGAAERVADGDALAAALRRLLGDRAVAARLGEAGRRQLEVHAGAVDRTLDFLDSPPDGP